MTTDTPTGVKEALADALDASRARTLGLLAPLSDAELAQQVSPLMSPLVWDLAHVAYFEELGLVRRIGGVQALHDEHDDLYDAFRHARSERGDLPILPPEAARRYAADVRGRTLDVLERAELDSDDALLRDGTIFWNVLQHEQQHRETMLQTLQLRDAPYPLPPPPTPPPRAPGPHPEVLVEGGTFVLGTRDEARAYDNERPAHEVELAPFRIDAVPVTNAEYAAYVEETGAEPPQFWRREGDGSWSRTRFGHREDVPSDEPVQHVSWEQADAYARWAGKRLPSEEEWERAAAPAEGGRYPWGDGAPSGEHANLSGSRFGPTLVGSFPSGRSPAGVLQAVGDVWEWTSSTFRGYPGFHAFPYAEYSEVFFGEEYRVLRGGSWATEPEAVRTTFRNWDYPVRRQIFAGFRCAADA